MNHFYLHLLLLFSIGCQNQIKQKGAKLTLEQANQQISMAETKSVLYTLAADSMMGRDNKSGGYAKAAAFVAFYFKKHKIKPFYPSYRDTFTTNGLMTYNLVGQLGKYNSNQKTILIGAHLDHIGVSEAAADSIFNGANDNASGATAVLQIGRFLAQRQWNQNVLLALFADEEKGLLGAYHLAERFKKEGVSVNYMINFEMIGAKLTSGPNQVFITGFNRSNLAETINNIAPNFVQFSPEAQKFNLFQRSDNFAFHQVLGSVAQTLSAFDFKNYDYYHKVQDHPEKLDIDNMNKIISTAAYAISELLENEVIIK
tara:strand:+ start:4113 stop:5054 length:942 start_codon:yes stop_codon:yes gene_type:complete